MRELFSPSPELCGHVERNAGWYMVTEGKHEIELQMLTPVYNRLRLMESFVGS